MAWSTKKRPQSAASGPDADRVRRELVEREDQARRARERGGWRTIKPDDHRSREILDWLTTRKAKVATAIEITRALQEPWSLLKIYVTALERLDLVKVLIRKDDHGHKRMLVLLRESHVAP